MTISCRRGQWRSVRACRNVRRRPGAANHLGVSNGFRVWAAIASAIAVVPFFYIVLRAAQAPAETWLALGSGRMLELIAATVKYTAATMSLAVAFGLGAAWLVERTDVPGRGVWRWLLALPLAVPGYVGAVCVILLLRRGGLVEQGYMALTGASAGTMPVPDVYSLGSAVVVTALCVYPYVFLPASAALRGGSASFEEAARMLGASRWQAFVRVTLPCIAPSVLAGALLVGLYALSDFGTVSMLRYRTFTVAIYGQFAGQIDRSSAAALSLVLVALTLPLLIGESQLAQRGRRLIGDAEHAARPIALGRMRPLAFGALCVLATTALGTPAAVLGYLSVRGWVAPTAVDRIWSVGSDEIWSNALNSLLSAGAAATAAMLLALAPAWLAARAPGRFTSLLMTIGRMPNVLPGILIGLALILLFSQFVPVLYGGVLALMCGLALRQLPQAMATGEGALRLAPVPVEETARSLGAGGWQVWWRVILPIVRPGIVAGWLLAFVSALKDLPTAVLLRPPGFDTLPVRIWAAASESVYTQAAPAALLLLLCALGPMVWLMRRLHNLPHATLEDPQP